MTAATSVPPPPDLLALPQWLRWRYEVRGGKRTKPPIHVVENRRASSTDPSTWGTYGEALAGVGSHGTEGVGFAFTEDDPFAGVDLDECRDPETSEFEPWAQEVIDLLDSYTEVSPSGTGLKIWVRGRPPFTGKRRGQVEVYFSGRYFTYTGQHLAGTPAAVHERQEQLDQFVAQQFPEKDSEQGAPSQGKTHIRLVPSTTDDDDMRLEAMLAKNHKAKQLWEGDMSDHDSHSEAVAGLLCHLAFWTNGDSAMMDRLFRQSKLHSGHWEGEDGKWERLGDREIKRALEYVKDGYVLRVVDAMEEPPPPDDDDAPPELRNGIAGVRPSLEQPDSVSARKTGGQRPAIEVTTNIAAVVDAAEAALVAAELGVYQRSGLLVRVVEDAPAPPGLRRPQGAPGITQVPDAALTQLCATAARWLKYDGRSKSWKPTLPLAWAVHALAERGAWALPVLTGVIECWRRGSGPRSRLRQAPTSAPWTPASPPVAPVHRQGAVGRCPREARRRRRVAPPPVGQGR